MILWSFTLENILFFKEYAAIMPSKEYGYQSTVKFNLSDRKQHGSSTYIKTCLLTSILCWHFEKILNRSIDVFLPKIGCIFREILHRYGGTWKVIWSYFGYAICKTQMSTFYQFRVLVFMTFAAKSIRKVTTYSKLTQISLTFHIYWIFLHRKTLKYLNFSIS